MLCENLENFTDQAVEPITSIPTKYKILEVNFAVNYVIVITKVDGQALADIRELSTDVRVDLPIFEVIKPDAISEGYKYVLVAGDSPGDSPFTAEKMELVSVLDERDIALPLDKIHPISLLIGAYRNCRVWTCGIASSASTGRYIQAASSTSNTRRGSVVFINIDLISGLPTSFIKYEVEVPDQV